MNNHRKSSISLATLIICLCLGSLTVFPFSQVNPFEMGISEIEVEDYNPFDNVEFDDDFLVSIGGTAIAKLILSKSRQINLMFRSVSLSPLSPPPKYS